MSARIVAFFLALACCCQAARAADEKQAEALVGVAKEYFAIHDVVRSSGEALGASNLGLTEVRYDLPSGRRFATFLLSSDGKLKEFILNGSTRVPFVRTVGRRHLFLERLMGIVVPGSSHEERAWGARGLDKVWTEHVRPLPVQVGEYVFSSITVETPSGAHDKFVIVAADSGAIGLKYRPSR